MDLSFYKNKRVFVTGHTGFKGSWLCKILTMAGADVSGFALAPPGEENLFLICGAGKDMRSFIGDIRDPDSLSKAFGESRPEIVIHMAAQPLVLESYKDPRNTYETNVMGTVNILECIRKSGFVRSFLNVTTDKVYSNNEWVWGYRENDGLGGHDPYSNSKACSELVTKSYGHAFFYERGIALSTARAGNVIGGGDFSENRVIPDCVRAAMRGESILIRNPNSTRPYQHVLDPLFAYLLIAERQFFDFGLAGSYNIGPDDADCVTTGRLADIFCELWGNGQSWHTTGSSGPHEANFLKLDCSKMKSAFLWKPQWDIRAAVKKTVAWSKIYMSGGDAAGETERQIGEYMRTEGQDV